MVGFRVIDVDAVEAMGCSSVRVVGGKAKEGREVVGDVPQAQSLAHFQPELVGGVVEGGAVALLDKVPVARCDGVELVVDPEQHPELVALAGQAM